VEAPGHKRGKPKHMRVVFGAGPVAEGAAATQGIFRSGRLEKRRQRRGSRDRGIPGMIFHIGDASRTGGESQGKRPGSLCLVCYFRRTGGSRCSEIVSNQ